MSKLLWLLWFVWITASVCEGSIDGSAARQFPTFEFSEEPEDTVVVKNQPATLHCAATLTGSYRRPVIRWKRNGEFLSFPDFNDRRRLLSNGSLFFSTVYHNRNHHPDEGIYQCVATSDDVGTLVSKTAMLKVADMPQLMEPSDSHVNLGDVAVFECRLSPPSDGFVTVEWSKDDRPLAASDPRVKVLPSGLLVITDVRQSDRAEYRCLVRNRLDPFGSSQTSRGARLTVAGAAASEMAPPSFAAEPRNVKALEEGGTVTLDCAANGNPRPYITWLKDGSTIDLDHSDEEGSRFSSVGQGSLQIRNVHVGDEGTYQCRAENTEDSIDAAAVLDVQVSPKFNRMPENTLALEKEDVTLDCSVYGRPQVTVQWYKNGDLIVESDYFQIVDESSLKILGLVERDSGIYQCVANNEVGNAQAAAQLKVLRADSVLITTAGGGTPVFKSAHADPYTAGNEVYAGTDTAAAAKGGAPGAPTAVQALIVSTRFITLAWDKPDTNSEGIVGYSVFYKQQGSDRERVVNSTRGTLEEVNIQGLQPGTTYDLRVVALTQAGGSGVSSDSLSIRTQEEVDVPGPVSNLRARATSAFSILVEWDNPVYSSGRVANYKLYYRQGEWAAETKSLMVNVAQHHLTDLREFTDYTFWVSAFNENGEGALSEEVSAMTHSDAPADPPQNVTLEAASSQSIIIRWEPPPKESQNGIITGYKIRWRQKGERKQETVTTDGSRRLFDISGLVKGQEYQVKMAAMTVNGSGPATPWQSQSTFLVDLDESVVPDPPSSLKARASDDQIQIMWKPPRDNQILVRGYTIGWGKGIPDEYTKLVDDNERYFVIPALKPNSEYVISLRAFNEVGDGRPIYETVRTKEEDPDDGVLAAPLVPPVGLNAIVLSSSTVVLTWMDSTLPKNQLIPDNRHYVVRYTPVSSKTSSAARPKHSFRNSSDLNVMIDDLKPDTEYEFTAKIVKGRRRQSSWSLVVRNKTLEAPPLSPPRDVNIIPIESSSKDKVMLTWRPPKTTNGKINGYIIHYTTNRWANVRDWFVEAVVGDVTSARITNLAPDKKYFFKVSARNSKGYGPYSSVMSFVTSSRGAGGVVVADSGNAAPSPTTPQDQVSPMVLYAILGVCAGIILVLVIGGVFLIRCKVCKKEEQNNRQVNNKSYMSGGDHHQSALTEKLNPPPPDLWIGHDQLELKELDADETAETIARSTPDYRSASSIDGRTRNYITHYSGTDSELSYTLISNSTCSTRPSRESKHILVHHPKPVKVAAINGKPRVVQRYLSRESVSSSTANGSVSNSGTYIRSQYNGLNPPPAGGAASHNTSLLSDRLDHHMDISLASPDDLPPPGYDPSLTDGPPSTIGDPGESSSQVGGGSIVGVSVPRPGPALGIAAQPPVAPQLPPTYLSSAMSTSSGDSGSNTTAGSSGVAGGNFRRTSSHQMRSFGTMAGAGGGGSNSVSSQSTTSSSAAAMPKSLAVRPQQPSSPFKRTPGMNSSLNTGAVESSTTPPLMILPLQLNSDQCGYHTGNLPAVADVRSPDVLHPQDGPCNCLTNPIKQSSSTEELHAEVKNLEGLMKDLNSISNPSMLANNHHHHNHHHHSSSVKPSPANNQESAL